MRQSLLASRCVFTALIAATAVACGGSSRGSEAEHGGMGASGATAGANAGIAGTAENGGTGGTSACLNPACPDAMPTNGEPCNGCNFPPLGCTWNQEEVDGLVYTAWCASGQWTVLSEQTLHTTCCTTDDDCFTSPCSGACTEPVCVNATCKLTGSGECWRDDQCAADQQCSGAFACGAACAEAGVDCARPEQAGMCVPQGLGCCLSDQDCNGTAHCIKGGCRAASDGGCYTNEDCNFGGICMGVSVCPCGATCVEANGEGQCEYMR